jgi:hypothetical protein
VKPHLAFSAIVEVGRGLLGAGICVISQSIGCLVIDSKLKSILSSACCFDIALMFGMEDNGGSSKDGARR